ncbi:hypothetical protein LSH36_427g00021 [Paralvinella palmiformis]|uniref:Macro domain-containing protein n=1 Tax=Paralvinella palmiformis TaxID=53620 RepID=A0AAD9JCD4_9ANNE|nr:hypothetical protein LSH36_427g00021 [Paralvinella palmiformis]
MYRAAVDNERRQQSVQGSVREVHFVDLEPGVLDYLVHMFENGHREAATTNVGVTTADCESSIRIDRALGGSALGNREQRIPPANPAAGQTGSARQQQTTFQHQRAQQPVAAAMPSVGAAAAGQRRVVSGVELVEPVGYLLHDDTHQIRVFVYLANVATLATDAIVNPTDDRLKHQRGISRAIAKFAGSGWRSEGQKELGSSKIPVGGVVCTGAGELPCRTVLHVVPPKWNLSDYAHSVGLSSLRRLTYTCLENVFFRAVEVGSVASVALPPVWSAKAPAPPNLMAEILFSVLLQDDNVRQLKEIHIVDTRSDFLLELKLRLDASSGVATCGLQVSPLGPEVEALVRRVMSASDSAVGDDGEVYSEIPAADNQPQKASPNIRSKIGKVTDRLAKLRIHKKQSHPNDANQAPSVLSKPGSLKSQTSYTDDRSSSSCSSSRSDIVRPDVPDRRRDPSEAPALPPRKVSPSHQNQGPTGFSPRSIPPKTDYPSP